MNFKMMGLGILIMLLSVLIIVGVIMHSENAPKKIYKVDCYDKYSNKIIGATCQEERYTSEIDQALFTGPIIVLMLGLSIGAIIGLFIIVGSFLDLDPKKEVRKR